MSYRKVRAIGRKAAVGVPTRNPARPDGATLLSRSSDRAFGSHSRPSRTEGSGARARSAREHVLVHAAARQRGAWRGSRTQRLRGSRRIEARASTTASPRRCSSTPSHEHWHRIPSDNARVAPRRDQAQDARRERIPGPRERAPARHRRRASSQRDREQTRAPPRPPAQAVRALEVMSLFLRCNPPPVPRSPPALCRSRELRWGRRSEAQLSRDERKGRDSPRCESRRRVVVRRSDARTRTGALQSLREDHLLGRSHCAVPK